VKNPFFPESSAKFLQQVLITAPSRTWDTVDGSSRIWASTAATPPACNGLLVTAKTRSGRATNTVMLPTEDTRFPDQNNR
jgi:hypothetical protein